MLSAIVEGFQWACSRATAFDLEAESRRCVGIGWSGGRVDIPKTPGISINRTFTASKLPTRSKIDFERRVVNRWCGFL